MIGFSYIYKDSSEVFSDFISLESAGSGAVIEVIIAFIGVIICTFVLFPTIVVFCEQQKQTKEKIRKKKLLEQILIQKEIENEIEQQVQIEEKRSIT